MVRSLKSKKVQNITKAYEKEIFILFWGEWHSRAIVTTMLASMKSGCRSLNQVLLNLSFPFKLAKTFYYG